MTDFESPNTAPQTADEPPIWTYPTRFCRICREDVPATVTMYPPGIPMQYQTPMVEYKNEDEYGRLHKPCMCRGGSRYIHELCLLRSRTENNRKDSMWKCHECGYVFNFQKLKIQRYLNSRISAAFLTILVMICIMFILGFIADPIINICVDPYDSLMGYESIWDELEIRPASESQLSAWTQHFAKGFISVGLVGFLKSIMFNPFYWPNLRWSTGMQPRASSTGRSRAVNIQVIALIVGVCSAFALFYRFVQAIMQRVLVRIGNNIVDTKLPSDDDDLKPPAGWKYSSPPTAREEPTPEAKTDGKDSANAEVITIQDQDSGTKQETVQASEDVPVLGESVLENPTRTPTPGESSTPAMTSSWIAVGDSADGGEQDVLSGVHRQGWSFSDI